LREDIEAYSRESAYSKDNRDLIKPFYVHFTTPLPTKGLEFDVVIAPYFDEFDFNDLLQANSAYVTITRPAKRLHIIGNRKLAPIMMNPLTRN